MKKLLLIGVALLLAMGLAVNSGAAEAEKGAAPHGGMYKHDGGCGCESMHHHMAMFKKLGLDEKQKGALRDIHLKTMKEAVKKKADIKVAKIELVEILSKDTVDMTAAEAAVKKIESLKSDLKLMHIRAAEEVKSHLNPEQKKQFSAMVIHMMMKHEMMGRGHCGMHGKHFKEHKEHKEDKKEMKPKHN